MLSSVNLRRSFLFAGDILLILASTELSTWIRLGESIQVFTVHTGASTFTLTLYITMLYIFDLYGLDRRGCTKDVCVRLAVAVGSGGAVSAIIFYSFPNWVFGRGIFLIQMTLVLLFLGGWRWLFGVFFHAPIGKTNILIIGAGRSGKAIYSLLTRDDSPYRPIGFVDDDPAKLGTSVGSAPVLGTTDRLIDIAGRENVSTAVLAITHDRPESLIETVIQARLRGLAVSDMPALYEELTGAIPVEHLRNDWLLFANGFALLSNQYVQRIKRIIDVAASTLILVVSLPIILFTAVAIKLESRGPVFFRQERVGKDGIVFRILKFRSMKEGAEAAGAVWASENDPRVTRVGRVIRKLRIDEMPQIINVFRGDMSLIGPRPERPEFVEELEAHIPFYGIRHSVRPGITGWAQVNYGYGASINDALKKLEYDLYYMKNMSILLDIRILLKTIGVVLFGQGAR